MNEIITNSELLECVDKFLTSITPKDKVCIIHDTDPDGICSAVIIAQGIFRLRNKEIELHIPIDKLQYGLTERMLAQIRKKGITKLITCDFSTDQNPKLIREVEQSCFILSIDHHKLYNNIASEKTVLYKPQLFSTVEPSKYCTAKLAYDAVQRVVDILDLDWMAAAASISDIATEPWLDWIKKVLRKYKVPFKKDLFQTKIGQAAAIISSIDVYDQKLVPKCFDLFYSAKNMDEIFSSKLAKYKKLIDKELAKHISLFEKKSERKGETFVYQMKSNLRIHSPLSTILGIKYPHRTIIIINATNPFLSVSARRGDKALAVNTLLEKAITGFDNANAGGHMPAAGAGFPTKYLPVFKKRIMEEQ